MLYDLKFNLVLIILLFSLISCIQNDKVEPVILDPAEQQWLASHREKIYFAPDPFYAPFEFYDEKDQLYKGLAHEFIKLIQKNLGIEFKIIKAESFAHILLMAQEGKVSIVNAATISPERSSYLLFTDPFVEIKNVILVRKGYSDILTLDELKGGKVSLVKGYAITEYIQKNYPEIKTNIVGTDLNAILDVSYKISDAAVIDLATASYLTDVEGIPNIKVSGDAGYPVRLAIGSRKDWPELNSILSKGLYSISVKEREQIYKRWISISNINFFQSTQFHITIVLIILLLSFSGIITFFNRKLKNQVFNRTEYLKNALDKLDSATEELRQREATLRSYIDNSPDGVFTADENGCYVEVNPAAASITGYSQNELLTKSITDMLPSESLDDGLSHFKQLKDMGWGQKDLMFLHKSGEKRWWSLYAVKLSETRYLGFTRDITQKKKDEDRILNLLQEKELLLKEVHHRIKNNMNTIKGLLTLQILSADNPQVVSSLKGAESRVHSMIMLYDRLYSTDNYRELSVKDYLEPLVQEIIGSFPDSRKVEIETDFEDFILNVRILSPLGIIVNELLTNIMKHAFTGKDSGKIFLSSGVGNNRGMVVIEDDGVGIPESVDFGSSAGFGLDLIKMLTDQIEGTIRIERGEGTRFIMEFDV